jgi:hypothetical protein
MLTYLGENLPFVVASSSGYMPDDSESVLGYVLLADLAHLGGFDMIVEVVSEGLDVGDGLLPSLRS